MNFEGGVVTRREASTDIARKRRGSGRGTAGEGQRARDSGRGKMAREGEALAVFLAWRERTTLNT